MADTPGFDYCTILQTSPVVLGMTEDSPEGVFSRLFDALVAMGCLPANLRETARAAVNAREQAGCTALANGIAIPHGYMDEVEKPVVAIGVHTCGVDCSSIDGQPTRIFILLLNHQGSRDHIRFLAAVNRRLIIPEVRVGVLMAQTRDEVLHLLAS
ncbi:MAG: PTS sugar transporter subunit IIA [Kiritimatiellae bacterium]|nr:PTS sugar transporter subunit IIA [Kiritimatiellia bacterium]